MRPVRRNRAALQLALIVVLVLVPAAALVARASPERFYGFFQSLLRPADGERSEGYCTLVDEKGAILLQTGQRVGRGDCFIDPENVWHKVTRVIGDRAETVVVAPGAGLKPDTQAGLSAPPGADTALATPGTSALPLGASRQVIVIYHTHSDESYIPSDGTDSIYGAGGVYNVGDSLAGGLTAAGFTVIHDRTPHDPHDGGAYPRSRRTVLRNLRSRPTLMFDLHRDSAPASEYLTTIGGVETARILVVVGGANPLYQGNLAIANRLKTAADGLYPGLERGIFIARGNYNQDLAPSDILIEVGTDQISRTAAERAGDLWARVVAAYLGPPGPAPTPGVPGTTP